MQRFLRMWPYMAICAFFLFSAGKTAAQTIPHVTGTFKTPEGKTPAQAGLKPIATIGAVAVYGTVDFQPYDSQGNKPARILCGGITYLPQRVRGWIAGDGTLVDNYTGAAGVDLVPEIGCTPSGLVMRSFVTLAPSADGRIPSVSWSEDKQIPQQASADWGALAAAGITAPTYSGYSTVQSAGASLPVRNILNFTGGGCTDNPVTLATDCTATGGGATHQLNGIALTAQNPINFQDQGPLTWSNPSLGNVKITLGIVGIANGGLNNSAAPSSDGQVPIWNAAQSKYVPGDPIVSGPAAEGAAPVNNPVWVAGKGLDGFIHSIRMANDGTVRIDPTGTTAQPVTGTFWQATQPVSAASLPLPAGAATEATLTALNTKIPASPATDRATAAAPFAARLSDGTSFYKATTPADTQPVSAASLPLPTGAATEATLSALNTKIAKSNNGAAPGANNLGTLPAVANAASPSFTEGNQGALSVDLSGNLRVSNAAADTIGTTTALGALNAAASVAMTGQQSASVFLAAGTLTGTLVPEFSMDGGTTWTAGFFYNPATNAIVSSASLTNPNLAAQLTILAPGGASGARARVSAYTSGTANATARAAMTAGARILSTLYDSGGQERGIQAFPLFARITDGTNNMPAGDAAARSIHMTCDSGCGGGTGGTAMTDEAAFTAGATQLTPAGGVYNDAIAALTSGQGGAVRLTNNRAFHVNLRNASGTEIGTAGSPVRVDPTGTTAQPVTGTFWQATQPVSISGNQAVNIAQTNGVTPLMGNGVTGTGSPRVTIASDNTPFVVNAAESGTWTVQPGNTANTTPWLTTDSADGNTGSAVPAKAAYLGGNASGNLTGVTVCDNWTPISLTANTQIIAGSASKQTYICSINLVAGAATNVAVVEGTGTVCATGIAGVFGGATAATGWNFAANGGIAQGTGLGAIGRTATAADNVCILVSAANQISGGISWTQF